MDDCTLDRRERFEFARKFNLKREEATIVDTYDVRDADGGEQASVMFEPKAGAVVLAKPLHYATDKA